MKSRAVIFFAIAIRVLLFLKIQRNFATDFYFPFLESAKFGLDPWTSWIDSGGRVDALPYGLVLFFILLVIMRTEVMLGILVPGLPTGSMFVCLLILLDLLLFRILSSNSQKKYGYLYLFSPIVLYVNFVYLQSDAIVGAFLLFSVIQLLNRKERWSGILFGLAVGCKYGILIILPFFFTFALANKRFRSSILKTLAWSTPVVILSYLPSLWSESFRSMVFFTNENSQWYSLKIEVGSTEILLYLMIYILLIIWIWRAGKTNLQVLSGFLGTALMALSLASTSAVGWHLWGLSLLILLSFWEKSELLLTFLVLQVSIVMRDIFSPNLTKFGINVAEPFLFNLSFTISITLGFAWTMSNLKKTVNESDTLQLNKSPLTVLIAGDSGVGKDTLAEALGNFIGTESTTLIAGDGYHKYERGNKRWNANTHLKPSQNDLHSWQSDLKSAKERNSFYKQEYDHTIGRFTAESLVKPKDLIVSQGLHALMGDVSKEVDVRIFMEMDDITRLNFKIKRDIINRNRNIRDIRREITKRRRDYQEFVSPQRKIADLVFYQKAQNTESIDVSELEIEIRDMYFAENLYSKLVPFVPLLKMRIVENQHTSLQFQAVSLIDKKTLNSFLKSSFLSYEELRISRNSLQGGSLGVMTVVCMLFLENKRRLRRHR